VGGGVAGRRDAGLVVYRCVVLVGDSSRPTYVTTPQHCRRGWRVQTGESRATAPMIDRTAGPWLIRRFVDPDERILFVCAAEVAGVADRYSATPFDVEGVFGSHRDEQCTFDTMLEEFNLNTPALQRLATVVRAADTNAHDLAPQAAGLLALSVGLSRQYRDDQAQLEAGMTIYDALYRWARDGTDEGHDWPAARKS